jgi:excinuclease ABC subunit C
LANKQTFTCSELTLLPSLPGVYLLLSVKMQILYVGKAKNLKRRVVSYFSSKHHNKKTQDLVLLVQSVQIIIAPSDKEAWLIELMLIQKHKPKYNIRLKDDKSYPYLWLDLDHEFPSFMMVRKRRKGGKYFGPYPNAKAARRMYDFIQKHLRIRNCTPSYFSNRSRPCMQYQINRCTAPCVNLVSKAEYGKQIEQALQVLAGNNNDCRTLLIDKMDQAAQLENYEGAAKYRDMLEDLSHVVSSVEGSTKLYNCDVITFVSNYGVVAISHLVIRQSKVDDSSNFVQVLPAFSEYESIESLVVQYCFMQIKHSLLSKQLIIDRSGEFRSVLKLLLDKSFPNCYSVLGKLNDEQKKWLKIANLNAQSAFNQHCLSITMRNQQLKQLRSFVGCEDDLYVACIDVSHFQGEAIKASFVVFKNVFPMKSSYRQLTIKTITKANDVAAISEAVEVFIAAWFKNHSFLHVLIIDGGRSQLQSAGKALNHLGLEVSRLISIAKGPSRKIEHEKVYGLKMNYIDELIIAPKLKALFDFARDESHRFAIRSHRNHLGKKRAYSSLLAIKGMGEKRAKILLNTFGSLRALSLASSDDIALIPGISVKMAEIILKMLRDDV